MVFTPELRICDWLCCSGGCGCSSGSCSGWKFKGQVVWCVVRLPKLTSPMIQGIAVWRQPVLIFNARVLISGQDLQSDQNKWTQLHWLLGVNNCVELLLLFFFFKFELNKFLCNLKANHDVQVLLSWSWNFETLPGISRAPIQKFGSCHIVLPRNIDLPVPIDHKLRAPILECFEKQLQEVIFFLMTLHYHITDVLI